MALPRRLVARSVLALLLGANVTVAPGAAAVDPLAAVRAALSTRDFERARQLLQEPARAGNAQAQYLLGCVELADVAGTPNAAAARHWFELAAAQHHARAAWSLAAMIAATDPTDAAATRWRDEARRLGLSLAEQAATRGALPLEFMPALDLPDAAARAQALWRAAQTGDLKTLTALAQPAEVAATDEFGRGALARAAAAGNAAAVKALLQRGARAGVADHAGVTPLMLAAQAGSASAIEVLLAAPDAAVEASDANGNTALMYAAGSGDLAAVERLLAGGASARARNVQDWSALDFAQGAAGAQAQAIATRLARDGATAVHLSSVTQSAPTTVRRVAALDGYAGWPDLGVAATRRDGALVDELLARGADPNSVVPDGVPVLLVAVRAHAAPAVKALLGAGADPARADRRGETSLVAAIRNRDEEILRLLLARGARDESGGALLMAVKDGNVGATRLLLVARASPDAADGQQRTALMFAVTRAESAQAQSLLDAGANANRVDAAGRTAAWYAAQSGQAAMLALLATRGAALERADAAGMAPLAVAAEAGEPAAVKYLLDARVAANARNAGGETPLHLAAAAGHAAIVAQLLAARADKDAADAMGDTPLMVAARTGSTEVVTLLLQAGASKRLRNRERATAADIAVARGFGAIARQLDAAD